LTLAEWLDLRDHADDGSEESITTSRTVDREFAGIPRLYPHLGRTMFGSSCLTSDVILKRIKRIVAAIQSHERRSLRLIGTAEV